ncbi:MAG: hypothetical protein JNL19_00110 [Burkholderiales bacterium]|nr:hypothetical protein [Burkholderiales bacterium]
MNTLIEGSTSATTWSLRLIAVALFLFGLAWTDCILVATAAAIAIVAHEYALDGRAPREGWRIAIDCWLTALVYMGVCVTLAFMVIATALEHWGSAADAASRITVFVVAIVGAIALVTMTRPRIGLAGLSAAAIGGGALLVWQPATTGCVVALVVVVGLLHRAWYLSRVLAPFVLRNDQRF